jgi:hypothetical protein
MHLLTLQWHEAVQNEPQQIYEQQNSKYTATYPIGSDPIRYDIDLNYLTVSGLHVEIFCHSQQQRFYIRNLCQPNPP